MSFVEMATNILVLLLSILRAGLKLPNEKKTEVNGAGFVCSLIASFGIVIDIYTDQG